jgi:hypothetical protein
MASSPCSGTLPLRLALVDGKWPMKNSWDEIQNMLEVQVRTTTDAEWDELKLKSMEATILAIIERLRIEFPDPE